MSIKFADNTRKYRKESTQVPGSFFGDPGTAAGTVYRKETSIWEQSWQRTSADIVRIDR